MHVYEVIPGIYKFISEVSFFKTYSTGYFRKQQNEIGYFCGMTPCKVLQFVMTYHTTYNGCFHELKYEYGVIL